MVIITYNIQKINKKNPFLTFHLDIVKKYSKDKTELDPVIILPYYVGFCPDEKYEYFSYKFTSLF